jgi:hypothetical protein
MLEGITFLRHQLRPIRGYETRLLKIIDSGFIDEGHTHIAPLGG